MTTMNTRTAAATLVITPLGKDFAIAFPFELKDRFRKAFPRGRWDPQRRVWTVGPRSRRRLEEWADEVRSSGILKELEARDERDLSEKELTELRHTLLQLRSSLDDAEQARAQAREMMDRAMEVRTELDVMRPRLDAAKRDAELAKRERDQVQMDLWARLEGIVDLSEIERLRSDMLREWRQQKAANRERFEPLQKRMRAIRDAMHAVGVTSRAVRLAVTANYNRPDRDRPDLLIAVEVEIHDEEE